MKSVTYAYIGPEDAPGRLAKRGTASDVVLFNAKQGDHHLNLVAPVRYPERLQGLLAALDLADEIILHPAAVDRSLGETIVGAELFGLTRGFLRTDDATVGEAVAKLLAKTELRGLEASSEPEGVFRERIYAHEAQARPGPLVLPADHAFPVKGIGTVILGLVRQGTAKRHERLQVYPGDKTLDVRSIQVHDVDHDEAPCGSRVGLAVKGIEPDEVRRGRVLAPPGTLQVWAAETPVKLPVTLSPHSRWVPREGSTLHAYHVLQDIVVRVDAVDGTGAERVVSGRLDAPMAVVPEEPMVLVDLDNKAQRFVGRVRLSRP